MMILAIVTLLFSFLVQGIISNYIGYSINHLSWFLTIYPLINLLILIPYFQEQKKNLLLVIVFGLFMDIVYTNTFILNACLFTLIYYFSKCFHFFFPYNLFTVNISNLLSIFLYHIISFLFLLLLRYDHYSFMVLVKMLTHSVVMTIIYTSIMYLLIHFIYDKLDLKEIK